MAKDHKEEQTKFMVRMPVSLREAFRLRAHERRMSGNELALTLMRAEVLQSDEAKARLEQ